MVVITLRITPPAAILQGNPFEGSPITPVVVMVEGRHIFSSQLTDGGIKGLLPEQRNPESGSPVQTYPVEAETEQVGL